MKTAFLKLCSGKREKSQSLELTKEVLSERKRLETVVAEVQTLIQTGLTKLEVIKMTAAALEQNQNILNMRLKS